MLVATFVYWLCKPSRLLFRPLLVPPYCPCPNCICSLLTFRCSPLCRSHSSAFDPYVVLRFSFLPSSIAPFPFLYPLRHVPSPCQNHQYPKSTILNLSSVDKKNSSSILDHLSPNPTSCDAGSCSYRKYGNADWVRCTWRARCWDLWKSLCCGFRDSEGAGDSWVVEPAIGNAVNKSRFKFVWRDLEDEC